EAGWDQNIVDGRAIASAVASQYFFRDATRHRDSRRHGASSTDCGFRCEARYGNGRRRKQCGFRDTGGSGERSAQRD
ncbi:hypothetical protein, partial [Burkholderia sp. SIMBA_024]|uniref:hypothetical protein n=1 Tax=Burkholderia sp. SIMBA_024 TaxID=3085768 RepID=UPI003979683F